MLDKIFRNPEIVIAQVEQVMDAPLPMVEIDEEVENIFPLFSTNAPALVVAENGEPVGIISRADLLEFVARERGRK